MGNSSCLLNYHSPLSFQNNLYDQIEMVSSYDHPTFGMFRVWKFKERLRPSIFSRAYYIYETNPEFEQEHQLRCSFNHQNLLQYYASTQEETFQFGSVVLVQEFFEYQYISLEQLLKKKFKFSELDIWKFLSQASDLGEYIYKKNVDVTKNIKGQSLFNLNTIYFTQEGDIKVFVNKFQLINSEQQDIYDMGLIALQMIMGFNNLKDNDRRSIMIEIAMKQSHNKYSYQLLQLLSKLLTNNQNLRPKSFKEVQNIIVNRQSQAIIFNQSVLRLSTIKQTTYINPIINRQYQNNGIQFQPIQYISYNQYNNNIQPSLVLPIQGNIINKQDQLKQSQQTIATQPSSNQASPKQRNQNQ